jgi:hypothetical protein
VQDQSKVSAAQPRGERKMERRQRLGCGASGRVDGSAQHRTRQAQELAKRADAGDGGMEQERARGASAKGARKRAASGSSAGKRDAGGQVVARERAGE